MFVALARIVLSVPSAKDGGGKRAVVHKLKDKLAQRCRCSVADVEPNAPAGRAVLGVSIVTAQQGRAESELQALVAMVAEEVAVIDIASDVISFDDIAIMGEPTLADKEGLKRDWDEEPTKAAYFEELRKKRKERES